MVAAISETLGEIHFRTDRQPRPLRASSIFGVPGQHSQQPLTCVRPLPVRASSRAWSLKDEKRPRHDRIASHRIALHCMCISKKHRRMGWLAWHGMAGQRPRAKGHHIVSSGHAMRCASAASVVVHRGPGHLPCAFSRKATTRFAAGLLGAEEGKKIISRKKPNREREREREEEKENQIDKATN